MLSDHLGSASVTANLDGTWNSTIQYTAFGEVRAKSGVTPGDYRYTGQLEQVELGLYYYVARWYDPVTAHFAQADTIVPDLKGQMGWNRYAYTIYNPIRYSDPMGHYYCEGEGDCNRNVYHTKKPGTLVQEVLKDYGVKCEGNWTLSYMIAVADGVTKVAAALERDTGLSARYAFKTTYGITKEDPMVFVWGSCPECNGAGGYSYGPRRIAFESMKKSWVNNYMSIRTNNVIHELGHSFNSRLYFWTGDQKQRYGEWALGRYQETYRHFPDRPDNANPEENYGYAGDFIEGWQQSRQGSTSEEFADSFIGWTYDRWEESTNGMARASFMEDIMPAAIDMARNK